MTANKLMIAAAGAGKTTFLVKDAIAKPGNVLITTFTEANESEIIRKFYKIHGFIPENITIQTWFSFLLQHGIKPYHGSITNKVVSGLNFVLTQSARGVAEDRDIEKFYFDNSIKVYSDKLSKLAVRCNDRSGGAVIDRISRIYSSIYIDEAQDLAGYDLDFIKLLFQSHSSITLVCDPRQVTYLTHHERRYSQYKDGKLEQFANTECKKLNCEIDKDTLKQSHRNNAEICNFSSKFYPEYPKIEPCICLECRQDVTEHRGIYLVKEDQVSEYISQFSPTILRYQIAKQGEWTFGMAKGLGFDRVLIYPPKTFFTYLHNGELTKVVKGEIKDAFDIAKLYVALTRARLSIGIVYNYKDTDTFIDGVNKFH